MAPTTSGSAITGHHEISYGPPGYKGLIKEPYILALACFASIGGLLFGILYARVFPTLANSPTLQGWMVSVLTLGAMFGAFINGPICDRFSRRWSLLYANIVFLIGSVIQCAAQNIAMIFVGRFFAGLAICILSMVVPLYLSELAPPNIRGSLVAMQQLGITVGIMVAFWLEYGTQYIGGTGYGQKQISWRLPLALQCFPSLVLAIGRDDEAFQTLIRLRRVDASDYRLRMETLEIRAARMFDQETIAAKYNGLTPFQVAVREYIELFTVTHLRKRTVIACLLQVIQQFTGIISDAIIYYAPQIFTAIGLSGNSVNLLATGVIGIINFCSTIPAIMFLDRWGRRNVLMIGASGMAISQLIVGTLYAVYQHSWYEHTAAGWAACVFVWIYISNFAFSIGCVNWIMPSEMFPPATRGKAVGVAIAANWLTNFIVALITPRMLKSITFGTFYFFLVFCIILLVWVKYWVPETKGNSAVLLDCFSLSWLTLILQLGVPIEEMDKIFGGNAGEADLQRIASIRNRLGLGQECDFAKEEQEEKEGTAFIENLKEHN
ncbi:hypothetical protein V1509DRAFT_675491 [Lipomyces kononenkoae]